MGWGGLSVRTDGMGIQGLGWVECKKGWDEERSGRAEWDGWNGVGRDRLGWGGVGWDDMGWCDVA